LKQGSFAEGWNDYFPQLRARRWQSNSVCRSCNLIAICGSCPGAAEMETGDIEGLVPQFCEIAHKRAFDATPEVPGHRPDARCCLGDPARSTEALEQTSTVAGQGCCCGTQPLIQIQRRRPAARALARSYGTPWHGEARLAAPKSSSTTAVFFLPHGSRTRVRRLT